MTVRQARRAEAQSVFAFFEEMAPGATVELFDESDIWIVEQPDGTQVVCIATIDLADLPEELIEGGDHIGMRIGTLEADDFALDLQGAALLATVSRDMCVRVNEQASRMWSYGYDILGDSVLSWPHGIRLGDACIVVNSRWESIGIGESLGRSKGQRAVIKPIHDIGTYLRDQGGK